MVVYSELVRIALVVAAVLRRVAATIPRRVAAAVSRRVAATVTGRVAATVSRWLAMATSDEVRDQLDPFASNAKGSVESVSNCAGEVFTTGTRLGSSRIAYM